MKHTNNTRRHRDLDGFPYRANVIDLTSRRRGLLERRGADPIEVAVRMAAESGEFPAWDFDTDDGGWAA